MTMTEFLLARIAEDEEVAREAAESVKSHNWRVINVPHEGTWIIRAEGHYVPSDAGQDAEEEHAERHDPARVLAECEAKRRIVELCDESLANADQKADDILTRAFDGGGAFIAHNTLLRLASVYGDHPDYDPAWA